jgi:hypothetical protein
MKREPKNNSCNSKQSRDHTKQSPSQLRRHHTRYCMSRRMPPSVNTGSPKRSPKENGDERADCTSENDFREIHTQNLDRISTYVNFSKRARQVRLHLTQIGYPLRKITATIRSPPAQFPLH